MKKTNPVFQEWALKSGFPFENDTLKALSESLPAFTFSRNYEYTVENEGAFVTRSIDFLISLKKETKNIPHSAWRRSKDEMIEIVFLIECKYTLDESYIFTPSIDADINLKRWPGLIPVLTKDRYEKDVFLFRTDLFELGQFLGTELHALSGRKVKEQSKERDSVSDAILQVHQGTQDYIARKAGTLGTVNKEDSSYIRNAHFFIPIVVTNAPLLLMKNEIGCEQVKSASQKEDIFSEVDEILVEMPSWFNLQGDWVATHHNVVTHEHEKLQWHEEGIRQIPTLFCNLDGLRKFTRNMSQKVANLQAEI